MWNHKAKILVFSSHFLEERDQSNHININYPIDEKIQTKHTVFSKSFSSTNSLNQE